MKYALVLILGCLYHHTAGAFVASDSSTQVKVTIHHSQQMLTINSLDKTDPMYIADITEVLNTRSGYKEWSGTLKIPYSQVAFINKIPILLNPGDQINIKVDPRPFAGELVYCGDAVIDGNAPARQQLLYRLDTLFRFEDSDLKQTGFDAFNIILNRKEEQAMQFISAARLTGKADQPLALLFLKTLKVKVKGTYASRYANNEYAATQPGNFKNWLAGEVKVEDPLLSRIADNTWVMNYVRQVYSGKDESSLLYLLEHLPADRFKQELIGMDMAITLRYYGPNEQYLYKYELAKKYIHQPEIRAYNDSIYNAYKQLRPGAAAFDFTLYALDGKPVRLSDFKGKMVVIDMWATWCATCVAELPRFEQIADSLKGNKSVVFLSIAWDLSSTWKAYLGTHPANVNTVQLRLPQDENDPVLQHFAREYRLNAVPRYMMIDKAGKIFTAYAPLPSDPAYPKLLGEFLKGIN
jgi:thiol-disulfide isomerase/thioredoxin